MRFLQASCRGMFAAFVLVCVASGLHAAVGFTLSTSSVPNDFNGTITLSITGLTSGQSVRVEKFADLNANGTVDASDVLVRVIGVSDGAVQKFGGVRNTNVAGDDDNTANGQITMALPFPGLDNVFGSMVGSYIFRVSDPSGSSFTPITQTLTVTAHSYPQGIQGKVTNTAGGAGIPGAFVAILNSNGVALGGIIADSSGNYQAPTPVGSYQVVALASGFVTDATTSAVTVTASAMTTNNPSLTAGTTTISGQVIRASTTNGISAVALVGQSPDHHFIGGFTDVNGNYSLSASANTWQFNMLDGQLAQKGLLANQGKSSADTTAGSATMNVSITPATALIHGVVTDGTNPLVGFNLGASDQNSLFETSGISVAPDGSYCLGVNAGTWNVGLAQDTLPAGYLTGSGAIVTIADGQAMTSNLVAPAVTAHLRGTVKKNGTVQAGLQVDAILQNNGSGSYTVSGVTDGSGNFDLGVNAGSWVVSIDNGVADANNLVTPNPKYQVTDNVDINSIALNILDGTGTIGGTISDLSGNPVGDAYITAAATISSVSYGASASSDNAGHYTFPVINGTWTVNVYTSGGLYYNARNIAVSGSAPSVNFIPTVITLQPQPQTVATGASASFTLTTIAPGTPTFQWQVSTDNGTTWNAVPATAPFSGTTTITLQISAVTNAMNNDRFRCVITYTGVPGIENSFSAKLTVNATTPTFSTQPAAATVNGGQTATFTAASSDGAATLQWQVSTNSGSTWANVTDNTTYSGSTTGTLTITSPSATLNGYQYRLVATDVLSGNSNAVTLTVRTISADFNGDGMADILWENTAGIDRAIWYLNGAAIGSFDYLAGIPAEWHIVGTADFDGDGHTDIAWENTATGDRTCWFMNGKNINSFGYFALVDTAWHLAALGDFNGDGQTDLIWENTTTGDRAIWFMNGTNVASFGYIAGIATDWKIVGAADFDGDGQTDLVWENTATGDRTVWFMNGINIASFGYIALIDPAWHLAAIADYDGDGKPDLLWENRTTGDRAFWLMNGLTPTSTPYLAYVDPAWHIAP
ncbi:MAG TPA: carboxypeptidase regulatory-like domain-containing protein [Candidatus Didemnitutus sp.]|nr:carboxypeptidase regulatory-like domain-containing protein [Candidatus Didemnitutus sp.]